jgi:hypothetical protein
MAHHGDGRSGSPAGSGGRGGAGPSQTEGLACYNRDSNAEIPTFRRGVPSEPTTSDGHPVRVRGDLAAVLAEHPADRLDPEPFPMFIDERDYLLGCGSSSRAETVVSHAQLRLRSPRRQLTFCATRRVRGARLPKPAIFGELLDGSRSLAPWSPFVGGSGLTRAGAWRSGVREIGQREWRRRMICWRRVE